MFRRGGFWSGFFRLTGAGIRAGSKAIPGSPLADLASVFAFIVTLMIDLAIIHVPDENGVPIFLLDVAIAIAVAAWVNGIMRKGLANLARMGKS